MNYKLTIYPALGSGLGVDAHTCHEFETKPEMIAASNACADLLLFLQDKAGVMDNYSNMFVLEKKVGNDWVDIDDE